MLGLSPREARARYDARDRLRRAARSSRSSSSRTTPRACTCASPSRWRSRSTPTSCSIDEVLAVGDASFQQKCFDVFNRMRDEGRTIVFVTHDMGVAQPLLPPRDAARARRDGAPRRAPRGRRPLPGDQLRPRVGHEALEAGEARGGDGEARVLRGLDRGRRSASGPPRCPRVEPHHAQRARAASGRRRGPRRRASTLLNEEHVAVLVATTGREPRAHRRASPRARRSCSPSPSTTCSRPAATHPLFTLAHRGTGLDLIDRFEGAFSFVVTGPRAIGGLVDLPVRDRASPAGASGAGRRQRAQRRRQAPSGCARERRDHRRPRPADAPPYEGLGRPITGPRALDRRLARFWHLTYNIARNEFKLKFFGSVLGYVWQVMRPLLLFGVLYVFFVLIAEVGRGGKPQRTVSTACSCSARSCSSPSSPKPPPARCAASSTARTSCARSSSRGW